MVLYKRQLILFGGYHDNSINFKYFNDLYTFDIKDYKWKKLEPTGNFISLKNIEILIYSQIIQALPLLQDPLVPWRRYPVGRF